LNEHVQNPAEEKTFKIRTLQLSMEHENIKSVNMVSAELGPFSVTHINKKIRNKASDELFIHVEKELYY
jgi:hypothetical protein